MVYVVWLSRSSTSDDAMLRRAMQENVYKKQQLK